MKNVIFFLLKLKGSSKIIYHKTWSPIEKEELKSTRIDNPKTWQKR